MLNEPERFLRHKCLGWMRACVCVHMRDDIRHYDWGEGTGTWAKEIKLNSQSFVCVINTTYRKYV